MGGGTLEPPAALGAGEAAADDDGRRLHMGAAQADERVARRRARGNMCNMLCSRSLEREGEHVD